MNRDCDSLDIFLAGDMPPDAEGRFASHLAECVACRDAVEQQRWIDGLLNSTVRRELESPRAVVAASVRASIQRRRRLRLVAGGLAAAAVILAAVGWTALWEGPFEGAAQHNTLALSGEPEPSPNPSLRGRGIEEQPRAVFVGGSDVIVVPVETSQPNVTIVRVYPTYQPSYAVQASANQPAAGGDFAWSDDLNGG